MHQLKTYINSITALSEESWEILSSCLTELEFKKNAPVLKEGEVCDALFFISSGLCKASYNVDGNEINTAFYFENEFAANIKSLTTGAKSEYTIKAYEKSKVLRIPKPALLEAYHQSPQIASFGRKVLEMIIARQEEHADGFKLLSARERYDALISRHPDFLQRVSLTQAASYIGISRETLSRFRAVK